MEQKARTTGNHIRILLLPRTVIIDIEALAAIVVGWLVWRLVRRVFGSIGVHTAAGSLIRRPCGDEKDTSPGANDAGLHEEGGHTQLDKNGAVETVAWAPGAKKSETGNGSISMFNGIASKDKPSSSELLDSWHVHTDKTQTVDQGDGTSRTYTG